MATEAKMPEVRFTTHSFQQLGERNINQSLVLDAVMKPDQVLEGRRGRKIAHKRFSVDEQEYLLRVTYEETGESGLVVTVYQTSKMAKYWRT
jgi:hypothetical protein